MEQSKNPSELGEYLSEYGCVIFDGYCNEPVGWGFKIMVYLGEEKFIELGKYGKLECINGFKSLWVLVTKTLSREKAIELYGPITNEVYGPRGGWKSTTFGDKRFIRSYLMPEKQLK